MYVCMYVCVKHACMHACMHVRVCVYVYIYIYVCIYMMRHDDIYINMCDTQKKNIRGVIEWVLGGVLNAKWVYGEICRIC